MDYGELFSRAWRIVWHNKFMLVLGFLAALGATSTNSFNYRFNLEDLPPGFETRIEPFMASFLPIIITLACLALFVTLFLWLLRLTAQAGLISAASRLDLGEEVSFGEAISSGIGKLGKMVGINLLLYGPFAILVAVLIGVGLVLGLAAFGASLPGSEEDIMSVIAGSLVLFAACIVLFLCLLFPIWLVLTVIYPFAQRGAVLQDLGVVDSIGHGWQVVKSNLGDVILLVIIFLVLGIGFGIVVALLMIPLAFLSFTPILVDVLMNGSFAPGNLVLLFCGGLIFGVIVAALNAILVSFRSASVTLAYQKFVEKKA